MITEDAVYSDKVVIAAPADVVWQILVDFDNYQRWNSFCPSIKTRLELGAPVEMQVDLGSGLQPQTEFMSLIEPGRTIAWAMANRPDDPIHAVRTQQITPIDAHQCSYQTWDIFSGPAAADMMAFMAAPVEAGFNRCAYDLKRYAESHYSGMP